MKDPAFLFYPNDYIGGTMGMTFEEKGAYIELLMLQFNRGHMTSQMIGQTVGQLWVKIQDKFIKDNDGLYFNARLELEIKKRQTFVNSRYNNLSGKNQYTKNEGHTDGHMTSRMENGDVIVNENLLKGEFEGKIIIDYQFIVDNYHSLCPKMNKVVAVNDTRKGYINARVGEYGLDKVISVLRSAGESDFLNGINDKAWKADFEWIMRPTNFLKILEGKYEPRSQKPKVPEEAYDRVGFGKRIIPCKQ